jgi:hypothetical protein
MNGQEVIMGTPPDRGLRVVTGLTLVILAVASAVLLGASFVAAYSEDTVFMLLAVGPQYVGMALLTGRFRRHTALSAVMLFGTMTLAGLGTFVYGSLWAQPVVPGVENYSGCVVMLLGLLLWIFVAGIAFVGWRTLLRAPEERSGVESAPAVTQAPADSGDGHQDESQSDGDGDDATDGT